MTNKEVLAEGASFIGATRQKEEQINRALQNVSCCFALKETIRIQLNSIATARSIFMNRGILRLFQFARRQLKLLRHP